MTFDEIVNKTRKAIQKISDTNSTIWYTTEWNICHHLACKLVKEFNDFDVDVELEKIDLRRPDIVIHKRGNDESNLVIFQTKKHPTTRDIQDDIKKIKNTFFAEPYKYCYGIFISIGELPKKLPVFNKDRIRIIEIYGWKIISDKKEHYDQLYNKYKKLNEKTELEVNDLGPAGRFHRNDISTEDMQEIEKVEKELEKCLDCLSDDQLKELCIDDRFSCKVIKIITERKIKRSKIN